MSEWIESTGDTKVLDSIEQRMARGEKVSVQDQLKVLRRREHRLAEQYKQASSDSRMKGIGRLFRRWEAVQLQIRNLNEGIMDSGDRGGGVIGQGSKKASYNVPH
ncbi:MAG TPA: hypothetical protein VJB96_01075 [Patescibacteria group bacterium]|nr:hypothetical protein [Patescibacteria group bacterium]